MTQTTGHSSERIGLAKPGPALPRAAWLSAARRRAVRLRAARLCERLARPGITELVVVLASALFFGWRVGRPSSWWDEAITRDVTSRSSSQIVDLAGHVDLVHTTYYLLVHALLGSSATVTPIRMLSVVAASLTAGLLIWLGRELGSARVGVVAAAFWTAAPLVTRYAQEARPYAMVAFAVTAATLALVRVCRRPWLPSRWAFYLVAVLAVGLLNILALLILVVHLSYVLATSSATVRRRWYLAAGCGLALLAPLLIASSRQSAQVAWLPRPDLSQLTGFLLAEYASGFAVLALLLIAIAGLGRGTHSPALGLGLSWALLPPVLLWTVSQAHPLFDWRYVFFTLPGTALALASLATLVRWRWMVTAILVLAVGGIHMQLMYRNAEIGHSENIRGIAQAISARAQPGDAVVFLPASRRVIEEGYPKAFKGIDDVALVSSPEDSATLWGVEESPDQLAVSLHNRYRVWVITGAKRLGEQVSDSADLEKEALLYNNYRLAGVTPIGQYELRLYERDRMPSVPALGTAS